MAGPLPTTYRTPTTTAHKIEREGDDIQILRAVQNGAAYDQSCDLRWRLSRVSGDSPQRRHTTFANPSRAAAAVRGVAEIS